MPETEFINYLLPYTVNDYNEVLSAYLNRISGDPSVISVYQAGTIAVPGVSDIDIIIIVKDSMPCSRDCRYSIESLDDRSRYIFMHEPYVVNESLATYIRFLYPFTNLHCVWGKEFNIHNPDKNHNLHFFIQEYVKGFMRWPDYLGSAIHVRNIIPVACSMKHSVAMFTSLFDDISEFHIHTYNEYLIRLNDLKESALTLETVKLYDVIRNLIQSTRSIIKMMLEHLDTYLRTHVDIGSRRYIYIGYLPRIDVFYDKHTHKLIKTRIFSRFISIDFLPPTLVVFHPDAAAKFLMANPLKLAFLERCALIADYESFIASRGLRMFSIPCEMHSRLGWRMRSKDLLMT